PGTWRWWCRWCGRRRRSRRRRPRPAMPRRYEDASAAVPSFPLRLGTPLRGALRHGYTARDLRSDLLAGVVVGIVALPLSMALAVASGVAPQYGLYTAIVAGAVIAGLGGSMVQVCGPTAAFVVLLAPISASQHPIAKEGMPKDVLIYEIAG